MLTIKSGGRQVASIFARKGYSSTTLPINATRAYIRSVSIPTTKHLNNRSYNSSILRSVTASNTLRCNNDLWIDRRFVHQTSDYQQSSQKTEPEQCQDEVETESVANTEVGRGKECKDEEERIAHFFRDHQVFVQGLHDPRIQKPIFDFTSLKLAPRLEQIIEKYGYKQPTPIQSQSLPILLSGRDLIGIAQTGSGKTLAYLLPALQKYFSICRQYYNNSDYDMSSFEKRLNPKVLILAPTRELAVQIFEVVRQFSMFKTICLYGGSDRKKQMNFLSQNTPLIVVSTPGRLKDLIDSECISLSDIEYLVVDEADRMLDMGFEPQIAHLIRKCSKERQTMMFSATWPDEVKELVHKYLRPDHAFLSIGGTKLVANHNIKQHVYTCSHVERMAKLGEILKNEHPGERVILFSNTKIGCSRVAAIIQQRYKIRAAPIHGDLTQRQRENTLRAFKSGEIKVLCATNVAARGLDIDDVSVVINYDMPPEVETYVHRIGRTGRKDNKGHSYSFILEECSAPFAQQLIEVLAESGNEIPHELHTFAQQKRAPKKLTKKFSQYGNRRYDNDSKYSDDPFEYRPRNRGSGGGFNNRFNNDHRRYGGGDRDRDRGDRYEQKQDRSSKYSEMDFYN